MLRSVAIDRIEGYVLGGGPEQTRSAALDELHALVAGGATIIDVREKEADVQAYWLFLQRDEAGRPVVAAFGAFVDVGVHQDGLVHISALSNNYVKDPRDVVKSGDVVRVKVLEVAEARKRIESAITANRSENTTQAEELKTQAPQRLPPVH